MTLAVREMRPQDWAAVSAIYRQGIEGGNATFETDVPSWERWDGSHHSKGRIVASKSGITVGWAALGPVSSRQVYAGVAEVSVYVAQDRQNLGIGRALLEELINAAEASGIWTLQASIFPENEASIVLHQKCGFRTVGFRERLAKHKGVWRNVVLMERRSHHVGTT